MTTASTTETASGGGLIATHQPVAGVGQPEYQVVMVAGSDGHIKGTKNTYSVIFKSTDATTAGQAVPVAFAAVNTFRQLGVLWHTAASTRRKTIKRVEVNIAATAAGVLNISLVRVTAAPATPLIAATVANIVPHIADHPASDALTMVNPTTLATYAADQPLTSFEFNLAAAAATANPGQNGPIVLFPPEGMPADDDLFEPVIRAGVLEGYAILLRSTTAVTYRITGRIIFTEE